MSDTWFTNKCMALIGENGRALSGEALEGAEKALADAKQANLKIWTDRNGFFYIKERKMFAKAALLKDANGNPVRICGKMVKLKAKFCSRCGSPAPGGWWRCGHCGMHIGNESQSCPHCGHAQQTATRLDIQDGVWQKSEDVFAERFEIENIIPQLDKGLNVQEGQCAILLEGGAVSDVFPAGFYSAADWEKRQDAAWSIVMLDSSELALPVCVDALRTKEDMTSDLHMVIVIRFDPANVQNFMQNLMGNSVCLNQETVTAAVSYDAVAHALLQSADQAARIYCGQHTISELFKDADVRLQLETAIRQAVLDNVQAIGMNFVRLKEVEFDSAVFDKLRDMAGQVETKRREIEYMKQADELANNATRREAMSEHEMEEYMTQLAHEKGIHDELRQQELERMRLCWARNQEKDSISHEQDLADLTAGRQQERELHAEEHAEDLKELHHRKELERRITEQNTSLEFMKIEAQVQDIRREISKKDEAVKQENAAGWMKLQMERQEFMQKQKIEMIKAASGADMRSLLMAEDDPAKREALLRLNEQEMQSRMTPELLLAAAAAHGNAAAAEALSRLNKDQLAVLERSKSENREIYEKLLQMNERMFNQMAESFTKQSGSTTNTTQIIK